MVKKKRLVIVDIKRFILFLIVVMLGINLLLFGFVMPNITTANEETKTVEIVVADGDTLWNIAQEYLPDTDTRESIYKIKKTNNLKSANLNEGQKLVIPIN